jgi:hypothetical protein
MESQKELDLSDMVDVSLNESFDLTAVHPFKNTETPNVEWLG